MFTINDMPPQLGNELAELLVQAETATIGHYLHSGFLDRSIAAVIPEKRVVGTAVTVRLPHADSSILHYLTSMIRPGDFVIVDRCGDDKHACWGGVVTHAMHIAGIAGAAIDGPATDLSEIKKVGLPVWCKGPSSITTKLLGMEGAINIPVTIGGQVVSPGDAVLADESGVVVLSPDVANNIAKVAVDSQEEEKELLEDLYGGASLPELTGVSDQIKAATNS